MINLLLVDDEQTILKSSQSYLEKTGPFRVDTAGSGTEALKKLQTVHYDAVVSDYEMPEMNGVEFLKTIRGSGSDIPFIIFTGRSKEDVVIDALNAGANFYIQKGGKPKALFAELTGKIQQAVAHDRAKKALIAS